jgi:orotate phosphoribosyltransferase
MAASEDPAIGFVKFALSQNVLKFGEFKLKSGRTSPYFFNAGLFHSGEALANLGAFYADAIVASGIEFDCLFGPAYKGIPLAAAVAIALFQRHNRSVNWAYNRKEAKDHGEGGLIVGKLEPRVLVVDDVITAGTAIRESIDIVKSQSGCSVVGVVVAMDRQERMTEDTDLSAIQQVNRDFGIPVVSIAKMANLITYLQDCYGGGDKEALLTQIREYREKFGVKD